jgi:hypothetical protein
MDLKVLVEATLTGPFRHPDARMAGFLPIIQTQVIWAARVKASRRLRF